ncbi:hypothetical protein ABEB36_005896 [Hypothenemus hampei]|uniref:Uncharacterized protein n=1 Tax=Hypothenemus hampei TaxID=57062 RepID=A0ABD1F2F8_HYPHA
MYLQLLTEIHIYTTYVLILKIYDPVLEGYRQKKSLISKNHVYFPHKTVLPTRESDWPVVHKKKEKPRWDVKMAVLIEEHILPSQLGYINIGDNVDLVNDMAEKEADV